MMKQCKRVRYSSNYVGESDYDSWKDCIHRKKLDSEFSEEENKLEMADTQAEIILSQGLPRHIFNNLNQTSTAKEIWDNVRCSCKDQFHKLVNDMKITLLKFYSHDCNQVCHPTSGFLGKYVTNVKQNMDISTTPYVQIYTHPQRYELMPKRTLQETGAEEMGHVARQCKDPREDGLSVTSKVKALLMKLRGKEMCYDAEDNASRGYVDEGPNAAVAFMANLSSTSATNSQVNEVHSNDNPIFDNVDYQLNQEMHQEEHLDSDAETEIDDNTIPYHQYLLDTEAQNVPTEVSADTSDKVSMIAILTDLQTQLDGHAKVNQEKCLEVETLKNELSQCKQEIYRLDTQKVKLDLENKVRQEQALVIQRNKRNAELVQENDLLKSTLSGKEKSIAFLQSEKEKIFSEKKDLADSYLDEIVCLKNANKVARDMLQRFNMPTQTIPMLSKKPKMATADLHKDLLGTRNPGLGYMAKRAQPVLYDADTLLHPTHHPVSIWDSEEVLVHQVVSMKKMNEKPGHVRPANGFYDKLNALKFVPQQELSREQAYWLPANERASQTSNPNSPVTPFVRKSRPPSQVLTSLRNVNAVFPQFEGIIKERTTQKPDYVSEWCFDYAKQFVEQQLVPFYDHFKKHIQAANDTFFKEIREFEQIFDDLETEYEQCVLDNKNLTIEKKNLLIKNDCLIAECLEKDICSIVLTSDIVVPPSSNCLCEDLRSACDREHTKVLELEAEISKQKQLITESEKRFAFLEQNYVNLQLKFQNYKQCIDTSSASNAIFEINKLRQQLQGKDDTIRNLDAQINIMKVLNVGSTEGSCDQQALDTDRIQLKDTITSLRIQLDGLKVENVSLKRRYDELSKANTHSRTAYTEKLSAFTAENTKLKAQVTGTTSSGPSTSEKPKVLASGMYTNSSKYIPPPKRANWVKPTPLPKKKQVTFQEPPRTSNRPTQKPPVQQNKKPNVPVNLSTRTNPATESRKPMPKSHTRNHHILPSKSVNARKAAYHNRKLHVVDHNQFVIRSLKSVNTKTPQAKHSVNHTKKVWKATRNHNVNTTKTAWRPTRKVVGSVKPQWKPTGRYFALYDNCPLTRIMEPIVEPLELTPSVRSSLSNDLMDDEKEMVVPPGYSYVNALAWFRTAPLVKCMRTRSQSRNSNRQQQQAPPAFVEPFNLEEPIENPAPPVVTMDDTRTMAQLLEAPTVGYEDAIVVPEITADNFELKHDSLNSDAGGNFLDKMPLDCLRIIESKSKVHNSRNKPVVAKVSSSSSTSVFFPMLPELKDMVKALLLDKKSQAPTPSESAAAANYNQGDTGYRAPIANQIRPPGFPPVQNQGNNQNRYNQNRGNTYNQGQIYRPPINQPPVHQAPPYQAPAPQTQGVTKTDFESYVKANDAVMRNMQDQNQNLQNQMTNLTDMLSKFVNANTASSSGTGSLPSNTVTNPKEDLKGITTRSGVAYQGPTIPTTSSSPKVVERETEVTKDMVPPTNNGSTKDVQPPVVQVQPHVPNSEPVDTPVSAPMPNLKPSISYPSRRNDERRREKANDQIEKFYEIFKDLSFEISLTDALILMPKFASTLKALIGNKEKLSEMARTPLNEHCSAVILNKLPEKLGDPGKFLIPCDFPGMDECLALADLGASINLMPLSVWEKLSLPELTPTCMTLELADRTISQPIGIAEDVYVKVGKFQFLADFVVVDFDADPRVPLILGRSFLKTGRALIDVYEGELTLRVGKEAVTFNLDQTSRYSSNYDDMTANRIDVIEMACEDDFLLEEVDAFLALDDDPTSLEVDDSYYDSEGDILLLEAYLN
ncbi:reverse transcriptase domain-containing protein [Tanacetum coccineum]